MDLRWQAPHVERLKNCYHMLSAFLTHNVKAQKKPQKTQTNPFSTLKIQINLHISQHFYLLLPYSYEIYMSFLKGYCSVPKGKSWFQWKEQLVIGTKISVGFIIGHKLKATIHLKPTLNNNKNLCHEKMSAAEKSTLSSMKAKASTVYYTFSFMCVCLTLIFFFCDPVQIWRRSCMLNSLFLFSRQIHWFTERYNSLDKDSLMRPENFSYSLGKKGTSTCTIHSLKWIFSIFDFAEINTPKQLIAELSHLCSTDSNFIL